MYLSDVHADDNWTAPNAGFPQSRGTLVDTLRSGQHDRDPVPSVTYEPVFPKTWCHPRRADYYRTFVSCSDADLTIRAFGLLSEVAPIANRCTDVLADVFGARMRVDDRTGAVPWCTPFRLSDYTSLTGQNIVQDWVAGNTIHCSLRQLYRAVAESSTAMPVVLAVEAQLVRCVSLATDSLQLASLCCLWLVVTYRLFDRIHCDRSEDNLRLTATVEEYVVRRARFRVFLDAKHSIDGVVGGVVDDDIVFDRRVIGIAMVHAMDRVLGRSRGMIAFRESYAMSPPDLDINPDEIDRKGCPSGLHTL